MGMYACNTCEMLIDDDYHPMGDEGDCPSCDEYNRCCYCDEYIVKTSGVVKGGDDRYHTSCYLKEQDGIGHDAEFGCS